MKRILVLAAAFLFVAIAATAQTSSNDSETLRALLNEVRQLRKDVQTGSAGMQRVEILLYRHGEQAEKVNRLEANLEARRGELNQIHERQQELTRNLKQLQERRNASLNPTEQGPLEAAISQIKDRSEALPKEEEQKRAEILGLENELQSERLKLDALDRELDELERSLGKQSH
jgi:hypothetical protein